MDFSEKIRTKLFQDYSKLINKINSIEKDKASNYAILYTQWGKKYPTGPHKGIMFYGRSTNGWGDEKNTLTAEDALFQEGNNLANFNSKDQVKWIEDNNNPNYNTNLSQILSLTKKVSRVIYPDKWYNYVVWSNLYKVAPQEKGRPSDKLCNLEIEDCKNIFDKEVKIFSPKFVILSTGYNWYKDFLPGQFSQQAPIIKIHWGDYYISVYEEGGTYYLATEYPQGKPYSKLVEKLIEFINSPQRFLSIHN